MESGGSCRPRTASAGAADPPGPHALTASIQPAVATRHYPYDANGNMTRHRRPYNTWDFKDRLVAVENAEMRADYTYDYTDRRIIKRVFWQRNPRSAAGGEGQCWRRRYSRLSTSTSTSRSATTTPPPIRLERQNPRRSRHRPSRRTPCPAPSAAPPGWNLCPLAVALTYAGTTARRRTPVRTPYRFDPAALQSDHSVGDGGSFPGRRPCLDSRQRRWVICALAGAPPRPEPVLGVPSRGHCSATPAFQTLDLARPPRGRLRRPCGNISTPPQSPGAPPAPRPQHRRPALQLGLLRARHVFALHAAAPRTESAPADPTLEISLPPGPPRLFGLCDRHSGRSRRRTRVLSLWPHAL